MYRNKEGKDTQTRGKQKRQSLAVPARAELDSWEGENGSDCPTENASQ